MELTGRISALQIANLKFSISGKLAILKCKVGDTVKKGQLLASLDKTELQAFLDRGLKQYDLERALFDERQKESLTEYEKRKYQDSLDISIKNVEIAKANLDAADLYASINGIVVQMDQVNPGDNLTPAGFVIMVLDPSSFYFLADLPEENLLQVSIGQPAKITLKAMPEKVIEGKVESIGLVPTKEGFYSVSISFSVFPDLHLGLTGMATMF